MRRLRLDRDVVTTTAAAIADREGLENLTIARVAEKLRVRGPSIYNHVDGREALVRDVAVLGARELSGRLLEATSGKTRREAVEALAAAYRTFARERPGVYAATVMHPARRDREHQRILGELVGVMSRVLESFGLADDGLVHATRGLRALLHGFLALENEGAFATAPEADETFRRLLADFIAMR